MNDFWIRFLGVRGSYPVSGPDVTAIGGHTSSVAMGIHHSISFFDAGTGIIQGKSLLEAQSDKTPVIRIFLTHLHLDHIQGLPFFDPMFREDKRIEIYCPDYPGIPAEQFLLSFFNHPVSPIGNSGIKADLKIIPLPLEETNHIKFDTGMSVETLWERSHPTAGVFIYKIRVDDRVVVYATDVEASKGFDEATIGFIRDCDVLIHDSQYLEDDYHDERKPKIGYGHSTCRMAVKNALRANVGSLYLFHFDPEYGDTTIETMGEHAREQFEHTCLAQENQDIPLRR